MAEITAALVKELREKSGAGMMDCKKALTRDRAATSRSADRLAAHQGPVGRRQEGRPRRRRGPGRRRRATAPRGAVVEVNAETDFVARNEQFQKFVGAGRPGWRSTMAATSTRSPRAAIRQRRATVPDDAHQPDRHHRREHEPAPLGLLSVVGRRGRGLHAQRRSRRTSARSACWWRSSSTGDKAKLAPLGQAARHARGGDQPAVARPSPTSTRPRSSASARSSPSRPASRARPPTSSRRWSRAASASSTRRSCCSSRPSSWTPDQVVEGGRRAAKQLGAPVRIAGFCASRWARASRRSRRTSRPRWPRNSRSSMNGAVGAGYGCARVAQEHSTEAA